MTTPEKSGRFSDNFYNIFKFKSQIRRHFSQKLWRDNLRFFAIMLYFELFYPKYLACPAVALA
jgi:hypothetical protein